MIPQVVLKDFFHMLGRPCLRNTLVWKAIPLNGARSGDLREELGKKHRFKISKQNPPRTIT